MGVVGGVVGGVAGGGASRPGIPALRLVPCRASLFVPPAFSEAETAEWKRPMDDLIERIVENVGIDAEHARAAVRIILSFLAEQGDSDKVEKLLQHLPGSDAYVGSGDDDSAATLGGLGGLMGGGAMEVLGKLQAIGLSMGEVQGVTRETVAYAREKAGDSVVDDVAASIPGLSQFL